MKRQDFHGSHFALLPAFAGPPVSQAASFTSLSAGTGEGEEKSSDRGGDPAGCPQDVPEPKAKDLFENKVISNKRK